ncbi:MAG: 2Fe-2S iron-sulfur cluster-binding protein, partial [Chloroflexota bacterium]
MPEGTLLLDAAARAGIILDMPCGGQGRCGRCRVKVESGEVAGRENIHLSSEHIAQGWVLSCTARVAGDVVVTVPPKAERDRAIVELPSARAAAEIALHWPRYPALRRVYLELTPPSLEDNTPDLERLRRGLRQEASLDELHIDLAQMQTLASALRQDNWRVSATIDTHEGNRLVDIRPGRVRGPLYGLAVDIGTTNVVAYLVNLDNARLLGRASRLNRQVSCGEDVISRIVFSQRDGGVETLQNLVVDTINVLVRELAKAHRISPEDIGDMVMAGNTTMTHLFLGLPPRHIREEPYVPTATHFPVRTAGELGLAIHPRAAVYCVPSVAA